MTYKVGLGELNYLRLSAESSSTSLCAIAALISIINSPNTLIYASFYFCLGRQVYSNALLASLNARHVIRGHIHDVDSNFQNKSYQNTRSQLSRTVMLTGPAEIIAATELAAHVDADRDHETAIYNYVGARHHLKAGRSDSDARSDGPSIAGDS
ncbi:hypothetical protein MVEN_01603100 [Mycena venus]|uniref:DUF6534 domain-containing protein n=1 Tax=Mycena venus TaxID=2733690 RepID=A0A8H6XSU6_9AGAR|nr:hypothetical protein MVEN_01603100 [Mycena venus]